MTESSTEAPSIPGGKVLLTGASGHVGANLLHRLLADGEDVRCLVYPGADNRALDGLEVERVQGDVRNFDSLRAAMKGVTRVFHAAAKVSVLTEGAGEQQEIHDINVIGTRNVARACLQAGVARMVLTGSFSAVGFDPKNPSAPSDESMPFYPFGTVLPYAHSKAGAEHELYKAIAEGLDAVIATSCGCIGPWDYLPSRLGGTMCDYVRGKLRAYIDGGFSWVAGRDIAEGHVLAMQRGRTGEKYIFATEFKLLSELIEQWREATGVHHRMVALPAAPMKALSSLYMGAIAKRLELPQRLTPGSIAILRMRRHANSAKAQRELGFAPTTIGAAIAEAFDFYRRENMIPRNVVVSVRRPEAEAAAQ